MYEWIAQQLLKIFYNNKLLKGGIHKNAYTKKSILTSVIIKSWQRKHVRQKMKRKHSRRPVLRSTVGNKSMKDVTTTSMATNCTGKEWESALFKRVNLFFQVRVCLTWVSTPRRRIITKKQMDQSWGRGIMATAWGYAMNAKPGPRKRHGSEARLPSSVREGYDLKQGGF